MVPKRSEEEEYFAQQRVEGRLAAEKEAEINALRDAESEAVAKKLGIEDLALAAQLVEMGFGAETVGIFSLLPLVYVAWADGDVSDAERDKIMDLAKARGADADSDGYKFLGSMLTTRPSDAFLTTCLATIRAVYAALPGDDGEAARQDLVSLSLSVANASGGFLGLFGSKVSSEEKTLIDEIVAELNLNQSEAADKLLAALGE